MSSVPEAGEPGVDAREELERYARELGEPELALLAQHYLAQGQPEAVLTLAAACPARSLALELCQARAHLTLGNASAALASMHRLRASAPTNPLVRFYHAQIVGRSGDPAAMRRALYELTAEYPDFPGAQALLAQLSFPGPPYRDVLARMHALLSPRVYLEIGVEHGATLTLAQRSAVAIGIDPGDHALRHPLPRGARLFRETSDDFFARRSRDDVLGDAVVDLAFIDGMHRFEHVLRDIAHVEAWCSPGSVIVLHDCLPVTPTSAERDRRTRFWVGDCWKAVECLLRERPDLTLTTLPCHPSGLVVLRGLEPSSSVLSARLPELIVEYVERPYPYAPGQWPAPYNVVPNDEGGLLAALGLDSKREDHGRLE